MKKAELIFIPAPGAGHLFSALAMAKTLLHRDERLSITVIIMKFPNEITSVSSDTDTNPRLKMIELPNDDSVTELFDNSPVLYYKKFVELQKSRMREIVASSTAAGDGARVHGIVMDMFCSTMMDVADEFAIPTYVFFASSAYLLNFMVRIQTRADEYGEDFPGYKDSGAEIPNLGFVNPVPASVFPSVVLGGGPGYEWVLDMSRKIRETRGVIINTFSELDSYPIESLSGGSYPPIYPVGPLLNLNNNNNNNNKQTGDVMRWLDSQPPSSVVFLCFGSMGAFNEKQVTEIAYGLENSGQRFLWSLRKRPPPGQMNPPRDYTNVEEVLPEGFLERTRGMGKVIGWAPQVAVLSHAAVGGFVSHCGWNSTLESVWFGVPMATWPLYAEQQTNAFLLVKELGMAVEITMDFKGDLNEETTSFVSREEIEDGIRKLMKMDGEDGLRNKVKDIREKSRLAKIEGGSSYMALGRFIDEVMSNIEQI